MVNNYTCDMPLQLHSVFNLMIVLLTKSEFHINQVVIHP